MAFATDDAIQKFGTQDEVISIAGAVVSDGNFSDSGDFTQWTNDDDAGMAIATLDATMAVAPDANSSIDLFVRMMNISDTSQNANEPSTTFNHLYVGSFPLDSSGTAQLVSISIHLPNQYTSMIYDPYVKNNGGQNLAIGSTVDFTPVTYGPSA